MTDKEQIDVKESPQKHFIQKNSLLEIHLPDPNPIFDKGQLVLDENITWKFNKLTNSKPFQSSQYFEEDNFQSDDDQQVRSMWSYVEEEKLKLVYQRCNNIPWSMIPLNNQRFFASTFFDIKKFHLSAQKHAPLQCHSELMSMLYKYFAPPQKLKEKGQDIKLQNSISASLNQEQDNKSYKGLKFNSNFESGNLFAAFKVGEREYDLILQNDTNSKGNTQWFHFSVENTVKGQTVRFNIINFLKNDSLFNYGQQPVYYSTRKSEKTKNYQWQKCGTHISYYKNKIRKENSSTRTYYSLTFNYKFEFGGDVVYFAQCYPYTYKDLSKKIEKYELDQKGKKIFVCKELCKSIGRLSIPMLVVKSGQNKPNVVVMARQHPGETPGSFMMEGVMDFVLGNSLEADGLRSFFNIYMIPMINPDGVVHGNYRCNLQGIDLNRIWHSPHRDYHDSVYQIKELIKELAKTGEVSLVLDLHGHSKKFNAFFYGNPSGNPMRTRLMPLVACHLNTAISIDDCSFVVSENKRNTARVSLQEEIGQGLCYTFETSFQGYQKKPNARDTVAFTQEGYKNLGRDVLLAFYKAAKSQNPNMKMPTKLSPLLTQDQETQIDQFISEIEANIESLTLVGNNTSSGSESNPEADNLIDQEKINKVYNPSITILRIQDEQVQIFRPPNLSQTKKFRRRFKCDKYTQTDVGLFQNIMLDPNVLKVVEAQLQDLRRHTDANMSNQRRPNSEQPSQGSQRQNNSIVNSIVNEEEPFISDIPHNSLQPIQINGFQYKRIEKRAPEYIYNFQRQNQQQHSLCNIQCCDMEVQTVISLQQVLGKVQIYQIKLQSNQIFKSSLPFQQDNQSGKKVKPLIILLQTPATSKSTSYEIKKSLEKQKIVYQANNISQKQSFQVVPPATFQQYSNTPKQPKFLYFHKNSLNDLNQNVDQSQGYIPEAFKQQIAKQKFQQIITGMQEKAGLTGNDDSLSDVKVSQSFAFQAVTPQRQQQSDYRQQNRWNSVHQSPAKLIQRNKQDNASVNDSPVSPPSLALQNNKNYKSSSDRKQLSKTQQQYIPQSYQTSNLQFNRINITQNQRNSRHQQQQQHQPMIINSNVPIAKLNQVSNAKSKMINICLNQVQSFPYSSKYHVVSKS